MSIVEVSDYNTLTLPFNEPIKMLSINVNGHYTPTIVTYLRAILCMHASNIEHITLRYTMPCDNTAPLTAEFLSEMLNCCSNVKTLHLYSAPIMDIRVIFSCYEYSALMNIKQLLFDECPINTTLRNVANVLQNKCTSLKHLTITTMDGTHSHP